MEIVVLSNKRKLLIILLIGFVFSSLLVRSDALSDLTFEEEFTVFNVEITTPNGDPTTTAGANSTNERTFDSASLGVLTIQLVATPNPNTTEIQNYLNDNKIRWTIEAVGNSALTWNSSWPGDNTKGEGRSCTATFTGLPTNNSDFGLKEVKMEVLLDGSSVDITKTTNIEVFYIKTATNNPGSSDKNWFYYWNKALGNLADITYGGSNPGVGGEVKGITQWSYTSAPDKTTRYIYDAASSSISWSNPNFGPWTGIDAFYNVYLHESKHVWQISTYDQDVPVAPNTPWRYGWSWNQGLANHNHETLGNDGLPGSPNFDDDNDGTIDNLIITGRGELGFSGGDDVRLCDPGWDTWPLSQGTMPSQPWAQNSPNEQKAWEAMTNREHAQASKDWGYPGKRHATLNTYND